MPTIDRIDDKKPKPTTKENQKKVVDFLLKHGHSPMKVGGEKFTTDVEVRDSLLHLHGVSLEQYRTAGGSV